MYFSARSVCSLFIIIQKCLKFTLQLTTLACRLFECIKILTDEKESCANNLKKCIVKNCDCHLWQGRLDACGYGEIRLMFRGRHTSLKAHRAVFAMSQPDVYLMSQNHDVSHLCINKNCVKLNHLSLEPHSVNNKMLPCKNDGQCYSHYGLSDCLV